VTGPPELQIDRRDSVPIVRLTGDVDISGALELREQLRKVVQNTDLGLVIDLSAADFLDSAGVHLLFEVAEDLGVRRLRLALVVAHGGLIERVVSLVDLGSVVEIHRTAEAAVAALRRAGAQRA
jgi:anti-sigma B factor antagonist